MTERLSYKGKDIAIEFPEEGRAEITIEDRTIRAVLHGDQLKGWACENAYFMSPDITELAKHLVDFWYIVTSPNTAPPEGPHAEPDHATDGGGSGGSGGRRSKKTDK
jgi:hypothetical protein